MSVSSVAMLCPNCRVSLVMSEREGVEIDYCPQCRGVWLDRGELDKILERNAQEMPSTPPGSSGFPQPDRGRDDRRDYEQSRYGHGRRKKSFLENLFD